ncbi:MAG: response regulator [Deltaproteobacteria bacterium]|jgi:PleD family two-component response regulator|nr:response regulator [Deltaproteobacteria bacterium]
MEAPKKRVMVVDDNITNLNACIFALMDQFDVIPATSAEKMFKLLTRVRPDLILLDVEMPGTGGYEALRALRENGGYSDIQVIFLTATNDARMTDEGLEMGALDYIFKPFSRRLLIRRLENYLELLDYRRKGGHGGDGRPPLPAGRPSPPE